MNRDNKFIIVDSSVLPSVMLKVLEVKKLLANKEEKSSASACKRVDISRSAYYKYRDCIFSYEEKHTQKIVSLHAVLIDNPGVLSSVLVALHSLNCNILTVNQSIPIDDVAIVNITVKLNNNCGEIGEIKSVIASLSGVVEVKFLSGE